MEKSPQWFKIAELEKISGVSRRTIHFYLQQRLLHSPVKTGKTMAYYDETHLRKLSYIKRAKGQGMPLVAIKQNIEKIEKKQAGAFGMSISDSFRFEFEEKKAETVVHSRSEKSNKTRETILEAGCYLFKEKGYNDTKIAEITKRLNIGKGTFYFYFSNKKELLLECVPRIFQKLFEKSWNQIREAKDPQKRLEQRAFAVLPVLKEFCAIIQLSKEALEDSDPNIKKLGEDTYLSIRTPLELDIERCIQQGIFQPIDPKIASTLMIGLMENLYYMRSIDTNLKIKEIWTGILNLMMDGMRQTEYRSSL